MKNCAKYFGVRLIHLLRVFKVRPSIPQFVIGGLILVIGSCDLFPKEKKTTPDATNEVSREDFTAFQKNFDTVTLPLVISFPGFLKSSIFIEHNLKPIEEHYIHKVLKMDSLPPWPIYYYGQLPMLDSTYYLITYFEMKFKHDPSMWWTLIKFNSKGKLLSETNISYCVKDSNEIRERFCKIAPNYQCFYVEMQGKWDSTSHSITDTIISNRTINLTLDQNR